MHLRRKHFEKELCDRCGSEVLRSGLAVSAFFYFFEHRKFGMLARLPVYA